MDMDKDYDVFVRELAMEKRAQPKDRTKTEDEIALEEKEALELAEKRRLRRMMGEEEESDDETGRRRGGGGDDLDDDFMLDEDLVSGLGAGLPSSKDQDDDEDSEETHSDADEEPNSDGDAQEYGPSDEGEEAEEGNVEELIPTRPAKTKRSSKTKKGELPFTFPCPANHDEFLDILVDVDESMVATVVERIKKLYHPSLHADNKSKLQVSYISA
jgi:nucleolar protein 14